MNTNGPPMLCIPWGEQYIAIFKKPDFGGEIKNEDDLRRFSLHLAEQFLELRHSPRCGGNILIQRPGSEEAAICCTTHFENVKIPSEVSTIGELEKFLETLTEKTPEKTQ